MRTEAATRQSSPTCTGNETVSTCGSTCPMAVPAARVQNATTGMPPPIPDGVATPTKFACEKPFVSSLTSSLPHLKLEPWNDHIWNEDALGSVSAALRRRRCNEI